MVDIYTLTPFQQQLLTQLANGPGVGTFIQRSKKDQLTDLVTLGLITDATKMIRQEWDWLFVMATYAGLKFGSSDAPNA